MHDLAADCIAAIIILFDLLIDDNALEMPDWLLCAGYGMAE